MRKYTNINVAKLLVEVELAKSISEAKRFIKQGAVRIYPPNMKVKDIK